MQSGSVPSVWPHGRNIRKDGEGRDVGAGRQGCIAAFSLASVTSQEVLPANLGVNFLEPK